MAIIKSKHSGNYTVLPNEIFKQDLSIEAIGMLSYFLSLPHEWVIYKTKLHLTFNITQQKCDKIFKELQNKGYLISVKKFGKDGKVNWEHIVYDFPYNEKNHTHENHSMENHSMENHNMVNHSVENLSLLNTNKLNTKKVNTNKLNKEEIPDLNYFIDYAIKQKPNVDKLKVELKYKAWIESNWKDGNGKKINNWKTKLLNTLPYIDEVKKQKYDPTNPNQMIL